MEDWAVGLEFNDVFMTSKRIQLETKVSQEWYVTKCCPTLRGRILFYEDVNFFFRVFRVVFFWISTPHIFINSFRIRELNSVVYCIVINGAGHYTNQVDAHLCI